MTAMETALSFLTEGCRLQGILCQPATAALVGVVVVVGGPQYRAGSHRQFVNFGRGLAQRGVASLRFDVRGMGDSEGSALGFEHQTPDLAAAIAAMLAAVPSVKKLVLFGLCDGASAVLLYRWHCRDPRVSGLVLLNPWVRSEATQASTQVKHYYLQRLRDPSFWRKLLAGGVSGSAISEAWSAVKKMTRLKPTGYLAAGEAIVGEANTYQKRMARAWHSEAAPMLILLSGRDYTAREFEEAVGSQAEWRGAFQKTGLSHSDLIGADHTLSTLEAAQTALEAVCAWLDQRVLKLPNHV